MQSLCSLQTGIPHILKVDGDKTGRIDAGLDQLLLDQLQHDRFSTPPDTGHYLDQIRTDERADAAHVQFSFDHGLSPLNPSKLTIV